MNYCQFRNDFIKRMARAGGGGILPREYQQVAYIGTYSTTKCYIDTDIDNTLPIEFEFEAMYFGNGFFFGTFGSTARLFVSYGGMGYRGVYIAGQTLATRTYYKLSGILHNAEQKLYVNDALVASNTASGTLSPTIKLSIFCSNDGGATRNNKIAGEMKYFKLWSNGTPIFDGIPCYRKSDNVSGLYDTVTGTLYSSLSGSNFYVGADV